MEFAIIGCLAAMLIGQTWAAGHFRANARFAWDRANHYAQAAEHARLVPAQHADRHVKIERAYNDLKARAYLRDAQGRMRHAKDVLK